MADLRDISSAKDGVAVTDGGSNSTTYEACRAVYVGTAGSLNVRWANGATGTLTNVPVGTHPFSVTQIRTGTGALGVVLLY